MRTNIDIDDALIAEAMTATGLTTKKAAVEEALRRLIQFKREESTLALYGAVAWEGDLEQSRSGRGEFSRGNSSFSPINPKETGKGRETRTTPLTLFPYS